jgi:16S rRNA G1207 methylase RsmC
MSFPTAEKELEYLLKALPDNPGPLIVADCDPAQLFAAALSQQFPHSTVHIISDDAGDFDLVERLRRPANLKVEITGTLDFLGDRRADLVLLRASGFEGKERLLQKIADAALHLRREGRLYLASHKRRGARGHAEMTEKIFGNYRIESRGGGGIRIISAVKQEQFNATASGEKVFIEETILGERYRFYTGPAVFSKNRVDLGTRFFLDTLPVGGAERIFDLGCGYGVIGIVLARMFPRARLTLCDVDLESVELARLNVKANGVEENTTIILSDGFQQVPEGRFDLVVSHIPLHIPRPTFTRIIDEAYDRLEDGGRFCGVALSAYDVRPTIEKVFGNVSVLAETESESYGDGYRVICASKRAGKMR